MIPFLVAYAFGVLTGALIIIGLCLHYLDELCLEEDDSR
jgi:hypothetical protein